MKKISMLIAFGAVGFISIAAHADSLKPLRLNDAIQLTLQHNPQVAGYAFQQKALAGEQQTAALKPALHASAQIENIAGSGEFSGNTSSEMTLSLSSVIELGDKLDARLGVVTARQQQLASSQRVLTLDVLTQVTQDFIALAADQAELTLLEQRQSAVNESVASLSKQNAAGLTAETDVLRAKATWVKANIDLQKKRQEFEANRIKLAAFWAQPNAITMETQFTHVDADLLVLPAIKPLDQLLQQIELNPDLALLGDTLEVRAAELRQARAEGSTNLTWNAGVRRLEASNDSALVMGISVPLGSASRASGAVTTASAHHASAELERDATRVKLQAQVRQLHSAYTQALAETHSLKADAIPLLTKALNATQTGFNNGRYSYLELNLAQRELLDMQMALINAAARAHLIASNIERITGAAANAQPSQNAEARKLP